MIVRDLAAADAALLRQIVEHHPFKPYRHHRYLSRRQQVAALQADVDRVQQSAQAVAVVAAAADADAAALVTARPLAWDSEFFGVAMGRIEHALRLASCDGATLAAALDEVLSQVGARGIRHLACKVDVADHRLIRALEKRGFRLMDAIVTYVSHPRRPPPRPLKPVGTIRPLRATDAEPILEITREAYRGYRGRFQLDPHLPPERSEAFYLEWARACCSGAMADRVFVAEDGDGRVIGWASVKRAEPVSTVTGRVISVGSLGACRADTPGAYASLICAAAGENHAAGVLTEAMTQNSNFAMVRVLEAVGAQYARAEYTFHAWLDGR